jgi:ABC-2 type transport system ATP-binding protein
LGPSGCGKTTLVNQIVGISKPTSGSVQILGKDSDDPRIRTQLGFMSQSEALYNDLSAQENLSFYGTLYGLRSRMLKERIQLVLEMMKLTDDRKKLVVKFSGGMKRRLSLAIALLHEPKLLVLDEPTVGLDPVHRKELWGEFHRLANSGTSLFITTHVMDEASSCDFIFMLRDGQILAQGCPSELITRTGSKNLEDVFLMFAQVQRCAGDGSSSGGDSWDHPPDTPNAPDIPEQGGAQDA